MAKALDFQNILFIMLTSLKDKELCQEAIDAGTLDYIVKPGTPDLLKKSWVKSTERAFGCRQELPILIIFAREQVQ